MTAPVPRYASPLTVRSLARVLWGRRQRDGIAGFPQGHVFITSSGADALYAWLTQRARTGIVFMSAYTCIRVVQAVRAAGWEPRYVDIDLVTGSMQEAVLRDRLAHAQAPAVILATHLFGLPNPMERLQRLASETGSSLLEDCAMGQGALHRGQLVGSFGNAAIFSFGAGKVLSLGAGGALVSRDCNEFFMPAHAARWRRTALAAVLARAGWVGAVRYRLQEAIKRLLPGRGSVASPSGGEFEPRVLRDVTQRQLLRLLASDPMQEEIESRRQRGIHWARFVDALASERLRVLKPLDGDVACYPGLPLLCADRDAVRDALRRVGVDCAAFFDYCAARLDGDATHYPNSERLADSILLLPMHGQIDRVSGLVERALRQCAAD